MTNVRLAFFPILLITALTSLGQKLISLPVAEFEKQLNQTGTQLLDVRTSNEYYSGHIKNSLQADWLNSEEFSQRVQHLDKDKPVYVYCGSGVRSRDAAKWLIKNGFQQVTELESGLISWKKNNKPIETIAAVPQLTITEYRSMLDTSSIVLIDFGAAWCPPCKKMEPILEKLQNELNGSFTLLKIDAGIHTNIMQDLQVNSLPTFIIYKNGKETWRKEGLVSLEEFKSQIR